MSYLVRAVLRSPFYVGECARSVSSSTVLHTRAWRIEQGLPIQKNKEGPLIDGPDYSFSDGRATPLLAKQKLRMLKQREFARKIVDYNSELAFAIQREKDIELQAVQEREAYIKNKLKPKGKLLNKNLNTKQSEMSKL